MGELLLVRHGETQWSATGRHTGLTDIPLTEVGESQARGLAVALDRRGDLALVLTSPLMRARRTTELAGLARSGVPVEEEPDLVEWDYGGYEGRTTAEITRERPGWSLWSDGVPAGATAGETARQVGVRCQRVLVRARRALPSGDVVLVGHAHALRVLGASWVGLGPEQGALLSLSTASLSVLGTEHERPVLSSWNLQPWRQ